MTMSRPADGQVPRDQGGPPPPNGPASEGAGLEARIPAVFVAVLATWALIAAWKAFRNLMG